MSYSISDNTTWATPEDLYSRYGDEYVDKLATRRNYDPESGKYVADETTAGRLKVINLALADSKALIIEKISCKYSNTALLETALFSTVKSWHIKLAIETLKIGGDCRACECNADLDKYIGCNSICSDNGECLISKSTVFSVSEAKFDCEDIGGCGC